MTFYEVVNSRESKFIILDLGSGTVITCKAEKIYHDDESRKTYIREGELSFSFHDRTKFQLSKETEEWVHFNDTNKLGYRLSLAKIEF